MRLKKDKLMSDLTVFDFCNVMWLANSVGCWQFMIVRCSLRWVHGLATMA
jgi:hypothetical protein